MLLNTKIVPKDAAKCVEKCRTTQNWTKMCKIEQKCWSHEYCGPCRIMSHIVRPCLTMSHIVGPCQVMSHIAWPCRTILHNVSLFPTLSDKVALSQTILHHFVRTMSNYNGPFWTTAVAKCQSLSHIGPCRISPDRVTQCRTMSKNVGPCWTTTVPICQTMSHNVTQFPTHITQCCTMPDHVAQC